ncbi:redox-sensitive transcriptional activator SoxR [Leucothrix mucor]|uniref:redox-sensitive transcriptional activator SoxR n=1 Tax=Leucothrix mucor TaxID=45248 RepID=UPI0003B4F63D|nr:redox-sensitive transcriptional activator SoxR [Leucothrix mucor]
MAYRGNEFIAIGKLAERTGVAVSALRFYEEKGLVKALRSSSGHRQFKRSDIRRISFVLAAQKLGFTLPEIREQLDSLPDARTPTKADWEKLSRKFKAEIEQRIAGLEQLRDTLDSCIGCGCLSLQKCRLYNPDDQAAELGAGPRYLKGNTPPSQTTYQSRPKHPAE